MADETAKAAKRALEEDVEAAAAEVAPAGKKQKTEGEEAAPAADGAEEEAAGEEAEGMPWKARVTSLIISKPPCADDPVATAGQSALH